MHNTSFEHFRSRINHLIRLSTAYVERSDFAFIVNSCRLKPKSILNSKFDSKKRRVEQEWIDEFSNQISLKPNIITVKRNLNIPVHCTDLRKLWAPEQHLINSKAALLFKTSEQPEIWDIVVLGNDEYLRAYRHNFDFYAMRAPIEYIDYLKHLLEIPKYFKEIDNNIFIISLPVHKFFLPNIINYPKLRRFLFNE